MLWCHTKDVKLIDSWTSAANRSANVMPIWHITYTHLIKLTWIFNWPVAKLPCFRAQKKCTAELPRNVACDHGGGKEDNTKVTHQKDQNHGPMPRATKFHSILSYQWM